jgi:hypothetical protein
MQGAFLLFTGLAPSGAQVFCCAGSAKKDLGCSTALRYAPQAWHSSFARAVSGRAAPVSCITVQSFQFVHHYAVHPLPILSATCRWPAARPMIWPPFLSGQTSMSNQRVAALRPPLSASPCSTAGHMAVVADAPIPSGRSSLPGQSSTNAQAYQIQDISQRHYTQPPAISIGINPG